MRQYIAAAFLCSTLLALPATAFCQEIRATAGDTITVQARGKSDDATIIEPHENDDIAFEIYFSEADQPFDRIEELAVGHLYRIVVAFDQPTDHQNAPVTLTNARSGETIPVIALPIGDGMTFRTPILEVLEEVEP